MIHFRRAARGGIALGALVIAAAITAALAGCAPSDGDLTQPASVEQQVLIFPDVSVTENIAYGPSSARLLDVCQPADAATSSLNNGPRRAILSVHGGSWREGDKASLHWRSACEWLASEGFVAFSLNYSLAPASPFPAAIDDVRAAVEWLRQPEQVAAYNFDPGLIGVFGGSAGGNLAALLGASGTGPWDAGTRVAAVVDLSGPIDLTIAGDYPLPFPQYQLEYLGCADYEGCASARDASPQFWVDPTDPPTFVAHSTDEFIPPAQGDVLVAALKANGVEHEQVEVAGDAHSVGMLDDELRAQIVAFLRAHL